MRRGARFIAVSTMVAALAATGASSAIASLPTTKNKTIVPGVSLGGIKLGMSMSQAAKVWKDSAGDDNCFTDGGTTTCIFELAESSASYHTGNVFYTGVKKVETIGVEAPGAALEKPNLTSSLNKYKTAKGVGIGAPLGKLKTEFGKKLKSKGGDGPYSSYEAKGPGKASTSFTLYGGKVESLIVSAP
jgi:hypothetical protein